MQFLANLNKFVPNNDRQRENSMGGGGGLGFKKESCCLICEEVSQENNILVKCKGTCQGSYHISCLGKNEAQNLYNRFRLNTGLFCIVMDRLTGFIFYV